MLRTGAVLVVALAGLGVAAFLPAAVAAPLPALAPDLPMSSAVEVHHPGYAHCHIKRVRTCKIKSNGKKTCTKWKVVSKKCHKS